MRGREKGAEIQLRRKSITSVWLRLVKVRRPQPFEPISGAPASMIGGLVDSYLFSSNAQTDFGPFAFVDRGAESAARGWC